MGNEADNVTDAFEVLLEEIKAQIEQANRREAEAKSRGDFDAARREFDHAANINDIRTMISSIRDRWRKLAPAPSPGKRRKGGTRAPQGARTPETDFCIPILETLVKIGGSGRVADVLDRVGERMKPVLKKIDYAPHSSNPDVPRWRNTAQWARNTMVNKDGRMKNTSQHGIWEISETGRKWLAAQQAARE